MPICNSFWLRYLTIHDAVSLVVTRAPHRVSQHPNREARCKGITIRGVDTQIVAVRIFVLILLRTDQFREARLTSEATSLLRLIALAMGCGLVVSCPWGPPTPQDLGVELSEDECAAYVGGQSCTFLEPLMTIWDCEGKNAFGCSGEHCGDTGCSPDGCEVILHWTIDPNGYAAVSCRFVNNCGSHGSHQFIFPCYYDPPTHGCYCDTQGLASYDLCWGIATRDPDAMKKCTP